MRLKFRNPFFEVLWMVAIFLPGFRNVIGNAEVAVVNGALLFLCLMYILFSYREYALVGLPSSLVSFSLLSYFLIVSFSTVNGLRYGVQVDLRDIVELHKPALYILIFLSVHKMLQNEALFSQRMHRILKVTLIIITVFSVIHLFSSGTILSIYTKDHNINTNRLSAPFVNPYDFAFFLSFLACYFISLGVSRGKKYIIPFLLCLLLISLTQSRSVFFPFVGLIFPCLIFAVTLANYKKLMLFKVERHLLSLLFLLICLAVIVFFYVSVNFEQYAYLISGLLHILESGSLGSADTRIEQFQLALLLIQDSPVTILFGLGPAKSIMEHLESMYSFYLFRYGLFGFLFGFLIPYICAVFMLVRRIVGNGTGSDDFPLNASILMFLVMVPFFSIGNNFSEQIRLSFFYIAVIAYSVTLSNSKTYN